MQENYNLSSNHHEEFQKIEIAPDNYSWIKTAYSLFHEEKNIIEYPILFLPKQAKEAIHKEPYYTDIVEYCNSKYPLIYPSKQFLDNTKRLLANQYSLELKTKKIRIKEEAIGCLEVLFIVLGFLFALFIIGNYMPPLLSIITLPCSIFLFHKCLYLVQINSKKRESNLFYPKQLTKEELKKYNKQKEQEEEEYKEEVILYNKKISVLNQEINENFKIIYPQYLHSLFSFGVPYVKITDAPQRGFYENKLFEALMYEFPQYVKVDVEIEGYYPDITLEIDEHICIDIEIDEPYEFKTKKEIHYIGIDDIRNETITNCNWFVLRLAEDQIKYNLTGCIKIIKALVDFIKNPNEENLDQYQKLADSIKIKQWTKEEARLMAIQDSRKKFDNKYSNNNNTNISQTSSAEIKNDTDEACTSIQVKSKIQNKGQVFVVPLNEEEGLDFEKVSDSNFIRIKIVSKEIISRGAALFPQNRIVRLVLEKEIMELYDLKIGTNLNAIWPKCRISIREQVGKPFWKVGDKVQQPKMTPANEEKGTPAKVHLHQGLPIYRYLYFCINENDPNYEDVLVETTELITEEEFKTKYK